MTLHDFTGNYMTLPVITGIFMPDNMPVTPIFRNGLDTGSTLCYIVTYLRITSKGEG